MVAQKQIAVGDSVRFIFGTTPRSGVVLDDRGPIGLNGVHIYRLRVPNSPFEDEVLEIPEDELTPEPERDVEISSEAIVEYLENGGLLQILRANLAGGRDQPRAWLLPDTLGNVVHTFLEVRGKFGGATVPFYALHRNRIRTEKQNEVTEFLKAFGLSAAEARQVTDAIGYDP